MIRRGEADDVGKGKKDTGYLYKAFMIARCWGCDSVALPVSIGNRTRATIKALPTTLHHPRPYGKGISFLTRVGIACYYITYPNILICKGNLNGNPA